MVKTTIVVGVWMVVICYYVLINLVPIDFASYALREIWARKNAPKSKTRQIGTVLYVTKSNLLK